MEQIKLDIVPVGVAPVAHASQFDNGRQIRFNLFNQGTPYTLTGAETVTMVVNGEEENITNTSDNYVIWDVAEEDCAEVGVIGCEIRIVLGSMLIGSKNFFLEVEMDPYDGKNVRIVTVGPADICTFETSLAEPLQSVKCSINPIQNGTPWIDSNEVNKVPYIKRAVAGTATRIGNHLYDKLVGGTVAFNQLYNYTAARFENKGVGRTINNGLITFDGESTDTGSSVLFAWTDFTIPAGHKIVVLKDFNLPSGDYLFDQYNSTTGKDICNTVLNITAGYCIPQLRISAIGQSYTGISGHLSVIDLTQMFGSTIADYIYSLEQATAGAGVAWFKALFPNDYYAYNAGELMSVKATAHVMKNASNQVIGNYALDSNLELRGIPKIVNGKLEYDGDIYESDGSVTRKYGIVDLGSLEWNYEPDYNRHGALFSQFVNAPKIPASSQVPNAISSPYQILSSNDGWTYRNTVTAIAFDNTHLCVYNDGTASGSDYKTAMSGVYLVYEKETPTEETATPFTNPQVCDENGTEEYTDSRAVAIPVGHETYQANICEITGFDELNVGQSGINLWDEAWELGTINTDGTKSSSSTNIRSKNNITIKGGETYYFYCPVSSNKRVCFYEANGDFISYLNMATDTTTFVTPSNCSYILFAMYSAYGTTYNNDISINYPATETTYHPYNGQTYTIAFGQTVYGGVLDVTRGKLKPCIEYPSYNGETLSGRWLSSEATYVEGTTPPTGSQVVSLDDYGSDIDITPEFISAIVGTNNVFADCGETTVKYLKAGE